MGRRMTKIRLKYIKEYTRNGDVYRYFRRKGCPVIALPGQPGSREFNAAYEAALNEKPIPASAHAAASLGKLIAEYYASVDYQNLKPNSRKLYRIVIFTSAEQESIWPPRPATNSPRAIKSPRGEVGGEGHCV